MSQGTTLSYDERNAGQGKSTILFIHGATSSCIVEFRLMIPLFDDRYHLLLPDLPGQGKSKHIRPFRRQHAAQLLADLVREKALNGKAHVLGFSMGSHVAVELASNYPELVDVLFLSGFSVVSAPTALAYGLWIQDAALKVAPRGLVRWLTDGAETSPSKSNTLGLDRELAAAMTYEDPGCPATWPARTLIIAAGKSGILPTADNLEHAKKLRGIGRLSNKATVAYTHRKMRHPWCLQAPQLFVDTLVQWIENGTVPDGFESL